MSGRDSDGRTNCNYSIPLWTPVNENEPLPTATQSKGLTFFLYIEKGNTQKPKPHTFVYMSKLLSLVFQANPKPVSLHVKASFTQSYFL